MGCTQLELELTGWASDQLLSPLPLRALSETCPVNSSFSKPSLGELQREEPWRSLACGVQDENKLTLLIISTSQGTVSKLINRYRTKHNVCPGVSTGRPKKTSVRDHMLGCCTACVAKTGLSPWILMDQWQGRINLTVPAARLTGGCWVEVSTLVVLPRKLCWLTRGRQPIWNGAFSTNIADCATEGMSTSLINLGIFFIVLVAEFMCVAKLARGSRRTVFCLLRPRWGISACLGCNPLWWPNQSCDLGEKHHCRHLQAAAGDRNASLC